MPANYRFGLLSEPHRLVGTGVFADNHLDLGLVGWLRWHGKEVNAAEQSELQFARTDRRSRLEALLTSRVSVLCGHVAPEARPECLIPIKE